MRNSRYILGAAVVALLAVAFVMDYRIAYQQGRAAGRAEVQTAMADGQGRAVIAEVMDDLFARDNIDALNKGMRVLRIAVRHPEAFDAHEINYWRSHVKGWSFDVEKHAIPYLRKKGEQVQVDAQKKKLEEASSLLAQLPK